MNEYLEKQDEYYLKRIDRIKLSVPPVVSDYINYCENRELSPGTRYMYILKLSDAFKFFRRNADSKHEKSPIDDEIIINVRAADIRQYLDTLNGQNENNQYKRMYMLIVLRNFYKFLCDKGYIDYNPADTIHLPHQKIQKPTKALNANEVKELIDTVNNGIGTSRQANYEKNTKERDLAIINLILSTGTSTREIVSINIEDVNLEERYVFVTHKNRNRTKVYISESAATSISAYLDVRKKIKALPGHENALFLSMQKKRLSIRTLEDTLKKFTPKSLKGKKKITANGLRHSYGVALNDKVRDIETVANRLRLKNVNTLRKRYYENHEIDVGVAGTVDWE